MSITGYFWVRIGDYGTPAPMETSIKDEFMAKNVFTTYRDILSRGDVRIDLESRVIVNHCNSSSLNNLDRELFFDGTYSEALSWVGSARGEMNNVEV